MKIQKLFLLLTAAVVLNLSCEKETGEQAPVLPPPSTMEINFGEFPDDSNTGGRVATDTHDNFINAAANVAIWNAILGVNLVIPVAAFKKAAEQNPVFDENSSTWVWTYNFNSAYSAKLTAKFVSAGVQWDMYISKSDEYTDVHWFTGTSNLSATEGEWHLNYLPHNPTPLIDIAWSRTSDNKTAKIKYTQVIPGDDYNGSFIEYGIDGDLELDAFYNIFLSKDELTVEIKWDRESKVGHIRNSAHFGDENTHCWNSLLQDVDCE